MNREISCRLSPHEEQLWLMRELIYALEQSQRALLAFDVGKLQIQTERQQRLCEAMQRLESESANVEAANVENGADGFEVSRHPVFGSFSSRELRELGLQVRNLNRVQAALLRRGQRSLEILACRRASCALTYTPPGVVRQLLAP